VTETQLHKTEVKSLLDYMRGEGVKLTHAVGPSGLPDPPTVKRHEPDARGVKDGVIWYGEAKTGEGDLDTEHALEQYYDFSHRVMKKTNKPCRFILSVPKGKDQSAFAALRKARAKMTTTTVIS
jgi:hypothetical protein